MFVIYLLYAHGIWSTYRPDDLKMDSSILVNGRRLKLAEIKFDCASERC